MPNFNFEKISVSEIMRLTTMLDDRNYELVYEWEKRLNFIYFYDHNGNMENYKE